MNKTIVKTAIATTVIFGLLLTLFYFGLLKYDEVYNQGVEDGALALYSEILGVVGTCEAYPFPINSEIYSLIIAECLQEEE